MNEDENGALKQFFELKNLNNHLNKLKPKNPELEKNIQYLLYQPLYYYEKVILICWMRLIEKQINEDTNLNKEELEAIKAMLDWVANLKKSQITAEPLKNRTTDPLFMDFQTKGTISERVKNIDSLISLIANNILPSDQDFKSLMAFFNGLINRMVDNNILSYPIDTITEFINTIYKKNKNNL